MAIDACMVVNYRYIHGGELLGKVEISHIVLSSPGLGWVGDANGVSS